MRKNNKNNHWLTERISLKWLLNTWTIITIFLFMADFFSGNQFDSTASVIGLIYMALLGIYAGEKEYIRWRSQFNSKFIGEAFVGIWTAVMIIFALTAPFSQGNFRVPAEFAVVYTSVVGVFAITQHSKNLHQTKR
ncbi:MAG: hypothetical protein WCX71_04155 [Candidatus Buchananbacteria bacterium]